jgi:hypothetical protein
MVGLASVALAKSATAAGSAMMQEMALKEVAYQRHLI